MPTVEFSGVSQEDEESETVGEDIDVDHETPAVLFVNRSIAKALDLRASDIHFVPQGRRVVVRARIDGVMREIASIAGSHTSAVVSRLKIMAGLDIAERRVPQDGRVAVRRGAESIDVRVAVLPTTNGEKVTLRLLSQSNAPASLDDLGLWQRSRAALEHAITQPYGAVVVVGPTGSGKTTTLYACLQELNVPEVSIVTIEDPVEYRLMGLDQIDINPRAGLTFASGLRTILRSDPDIVLVGEIRDEETAEIAFRAAMTGHLVLTTLHAQTAAASLQRLLDIDVDRSIIASSVNAFVAQRLVRKLCPTCREPYAADGDELPRPGRPGRDRADHPAPRGRLPRLRRHRLQGPRRRVRGDDDERHDRDHDRRLVPRDRGPGRPRGDAHAARGRRPPLGRRCDLDRRGAPRGRQPVVRSH